MPVVGLFLGESDTRDLFIATLVGFEDADPGLTALGRPNTGSESLSHQLLPLVSQETAEVDAWVIAQNSCLSHWTTHAQETSDSPSRPEAADRRPQYRCCWSHHTRLLPLQHMYCTLETNETPPVHNTR